MAVGSTPKKPKQKRRSSDHRKHHNHDDDAATMASPAPPRSRGYGAYLRRCFSPPSALVVLCLFLLCVIWKRIPISRLPPPPRFYSFDVVNEFPHDPNAFTQGLLYGGNDTLFESTGLYSRSSLREVLLQTGKVLLSLRGFTLWSFKLLKPLCTNFLVVLVLNGIQKQRVQLGTGPGLSPNGWIFIWGRLFQVTWLENTGFIYDRYNFNKREKFTHQMHDGWGLATDGKVLFGSDGSSTLYQIDPLTLKVIKRVTVRYNDHEVPFLNELEYVNGEVWANIWQTDCIARISQEDGLVISWILLHGLRQGLLRSGHTAIDVLNGIAWDKEKNRLFVTGKLWPKLYEIKLRPVRGPSNGRIENLCPIRA
ncbi:glutaminyl-peptide cyclotransferase isoform X1 [Typha latifolia]|uniref:glutaminyl-peptide cyclotransferase isoform X1 n=1 Tax=Typha latifolia TaxID=4733 RepID=UPI003C2D1BE2